MKRRLYKRRAPGERFLIIPFDLLLSLPEQHLTVLIDMSKRHNGHNNGTIGYGWRDAARAANVSRAGRILDDLRQRGIIELTSDASFSEKTGRRAREWKIPFLDPNNSTFRQKRKVCLEHWLLNSASFGKARPAERKLLIELMRRYDGSNNAKIEYGVESGASIGLSRTRTSRGLSRLEQLGFLVETDAADPQHGRPRRWRLTMYPAAGKPATKDFMRPKPALENSFHGCSGATDPAVSAALVQPNKMAAEQSAGDVALKFTQNVLPVKGLTETSFSSARAAQSATHSFTTAAHIEASQAARRPGRRQRPLGPQHRWRHLRPRSRSTGHQPHPQQNPFPSRMRASAFRTTRRSNGREADENPARAGACRGANAVGPSAIATQCRADDSPRPLFRSSRCDAPRKPNCDSDNPGAA